MKPIDRYCKSLTTAISLGAALLSGSLLARAAEPEDYHPNDTRIFKAAACTKDHKPVEALYYIAASRADMAKGRPSPTAQLMKEEVDQNWKKIASALTRDEVVEERFAEQYHALLTELIPALQQAVKEKSGVSVYVSEVNSRSMDRAKDKDVPSCGGE
jgi:hypothetical protein